MVGGQQDKKSEKRINMGEKCKKMKILGRTIKEWIKYKNQQLKDIKKQYIKNRR